MCSIMGYTGKDISKKEFLEGFEKTITRGPDMSRVIEAGSGIMAFHRLAIMDLEETGMQPFERDGDHAICNGEIYGFRGLKRIWKVKATNFHLTVTARSYFLFTGSMGSKCSGYWMQSSR